MVSSGRRDHGGRGTTVGETRLRVLLADEHSIFRWGLRRVLAEEPDLIVVAEAGDNEQALAVATRIQFDVALISADLPPAGGAATARHLVGTGGERPVIVLARTDDLSTVMAAVEAGAIGFVSKQAPTRELLGAIRAACRGEAALPRRIVGPLVGALLQQGRARSSAGRHLAKLSVRERTVLACVAEGATNQAIGEALGISPQTARTHVQNCFSKLGVHSRLEAMAFVRNNDLAIELRDGLDGGVLELASNDRRPAPVLSALMEGPR